ncbi:MAG: hypothetical protein IT556_16095 [Acetobacteraceae bacterium]|nr:hypothetical protein [Acetobacteraceae bacterium]
MATPPPTPQGADARHWAQHGTPSPIAALALLAVALLCILGAALLAASFAVPRSAYLLAVLAGALGLGIITGRRRPTAGWLVGGGVAVLGLLAGAYSLVMLPEAMTGGEPPVATLARAATALASAIFLVRALIVLRHRRRPTPGPLSPIPWR